jgi:hypothetical protein
METLHLRAEHDVIEKLMAMVNQIAKEGQEVEVLDNTVFKEEQKIIFKGLNDELKGNIIKHEDLWVELLK